MSEFVVPLKRLQNRSQFLRAARGRRYATPGLVLQAARPDKDLDINEISFGVTATKKLGNAVVRNRAKRRLRAVAEAVFPVSGKAGTEYVLIGRQGTLDRSFEKLLEDLELALQMISKPRPRDQRKRRRQ